jgi:curli biogenesis system outer membrane secretion channel CsgG
VRQVETLGVVKPQVTFNINSDNIVTVKAFSFSILFCIFCLILQGCSYHLGYGKRRLKGGYTEVAIPMFKNKTNDVNIETYFTNSLIREFHRSRVASVRSKIFAPVTVEGTVTDIQISRGGIGTGVGLPGETSLASSYRVVISTQLRLKRNSDGKIIWSSQFEGEQVYLAPQVKSAGINTVNPLYNNSIRQDLYEQIAKDIMNIAYNRMTEVL